jgi:uncharacterized OB-fold protein
MNVGAHAGLEPFFPGLFEEAAFPDGSPRLVASHCPKCGRHAYPAKRYCPSCSSAGQDRVFLSGDGRIYAFTHVKRPPQSMAGPYVAAYVDMDEAVRLFSRIDADPDALRIGDRVRIVFGPLEGGEPGRLGDWFIPSAAEAP